MSRKPKAFSLTRKTPLGEKMRKFNTNERGNLRLQYAREAHQRADEEHDKYLAALRAELGHDRFQVTNIFCVVEGILGHVYAWDTKWQPMSGAGMRKCIYCGCDDHEF